MKWLALSICLENKSVHLSHFFPKLAVFPWFMGCIGPLLLVKRPRGPQGAVALLASAKFPDYLSVSGPQAEIGARDSPITTIIPKL